jgi:hypothetical protein
MSTRGGKRFEDGFMKHKHDLNGLANYLVDLGVIAKGDGIYRGI